MIWGMQNPWLRKPLVVLAFPFVLLAACIEASLVVWIEARAAWKQD